MRTNVLTSDANRGAVALITGGGTGIGRATAEALAATGAKVVICGRRAEPLEDVRGRIRSMGGTCLSVEADVREPDQVERVVDMAMQAFGRIDILVNNAGGQFHAPAEQISLNGWKAVHRLNLEAVWNVTRTVATTAMVPQRHGVIFFISFSPRRGIPGFAHSAAARAGVENLATSLALEWSRFGIRSIAVAVGTVATEGLQNTYPPELIRAWAEAVPLKRLGQPEDVAGLIAFLSTEQAGYITGTVVTVDGGADAWGAGSPPPPLELL
jgi:citronellol/citronellal dehydrogenase